MSGFEDLYESHIRIPLDAASRLMIELTHPTEPPPAPEKTASVEAGLQTLARLQKMAQLPDQQQLAVEQAERAALTDPNTQAALDYQQAMAEREEFARQVEEMQQQMAQMQQEMAATQQQAAAAQQQASEAQQIADEQAAMAQSEAMQKHDAIQQAIQATDKSMQDQMLASQHRAEVFNLAEDLKNQVDALKQSVEQTQSHAATNPVEAQAAAEEQAAVEQATAVAPKKGQKAARQGQEQVQAQQAQEAQALEAPPIPPLAMPGAGAKVPGAPKIPTPIGGAGGMTSGGRPKHASAMRVLRRLPADIMPATAYGAVVGAGVAAPIGALRGAISEGEGRRAEGARRGAVRGAAAGLALGAAHGFGTSYTTRSMASKGVHYAVTGGVHAGNRLRSLLGKPVLGPAQLTEKLQLIEKVLKPYYDHSRLPLEAGDQALLSASAGLAAGLYAGFRKGGKAARLERRAGKAERRGKLVKAVRLHARARKERNIEGNLLDAVRSTAGALKARFQKTASGGHDYAPTPIGETHGIVALYRAVKELSLGDDKIRTALRDVSRQHDIYDTPVDDFLGYLELRAPLPFPATEAAAKSKTAASVETARRLGEQLGIDWSKVDFEPSDLAEGMDVEKEHTKPGVEVAPDKPIALTTATIAVAHLKERGDYYKLLKAVEEAPKQKSAAAVPIPANRAIVPVGIVVDATGEEVGKRAGSAFRKLKGMAYRGAKRGSRFAKDVGLSLVRNPLSTLGGGTVGGIVGARSSRAVADSRLANRKDISASEKRRISGRAARRGALTGMLVGGISGGVTGSEYRQAQVTRSLIGLQKALRMYQFERKMNHDLAAMGLSKGERFLEAERENWIRLGDAVRKHFSNLTPSERRAAGRYYMKMSARKSRTTKHTSSNEDKLMDMLQWSTAGVGKMHVRRQAIGMGAGTLGSAATAIGIGATSVPRRKEK